VLDVCQTSRHAEEFEDLYQSIPEILRDIAIRDEDSRMSKLELMESLHRVADFPIFRAFVSMLVRCEPLHQFAGAEDVIQEGFAKEFGASQREREQELRLSYQVLDRDNFHPTPYSVFYPIQPRFASLARNLADRFASRLIRRGVLFPQVQRRKNMSQDSCWRLYQAGYRDGDREWKDFRTLDLELHAYRTGERIQGDCEMRMAWKFNELKPRFYYAIGASQYWSSRWIKFPTIDLMECLPSTKLERRKHPEDIQYSLQESDFLTIWDMASFTSSLSELKHFLFYIAKNLEENIYVQQNPLRCLDYRDGIIEITADQLLLQYNDEVNTRAPFSIWRVLDKLMMESDRWERFEQKNSGMLGVQGNIGFSTAFHGFHLEAGVIEGTGCSVGDDALGGTKEDPRDKFIPHLKLIGDIQEAKVDILNPLSDVDFEQVSKFVKRRFRRTHMGIEILPNFAFPSLANVFQTRDDYHTIPDAPEDEQVKKFVTQVSALLWDLHSSGFLEDIEYDLIRRVLHKSYRRLGLRSTGTLPGHKHRAFKEGLMMAVPPIDFDFVRFDWAEYLWDTSIERWAKLPLIQGEIPVPPYESGMVFEATGGRMVDALEDIGCVRKIRILDEWVEVLETNRRRFRSYLQGDKHTYLCRYTEHCPDWFNDVFNDRVRVPLHYGM